MIPATEALARLRDGNRRFADGHGEQAPDYKARRSELLEGQQPFAIVLGCSDSRVPVEMIFDQGLGDLFVIRVAGNVVAPHQTGSVEYAVAHLGARLVVVLGHSNCGAVTAALAELEKPSGNLSPNVSSITDHIQPSVSELLEANPEETRETLLQKAIRANVRTSVKQLELESEVLSQLIRDNGLLIVGAEYSLETGGVEFFEE